MIKILIVDDSATEVMLLKQLFATQSDMEVVGSAKNGEEAIKLTHQLQPNIITMDIQMPVMNGFEATRIIMAQHPTPIVVVSSAVNDEALNITFQALEAGALSVLEKPRDVGLPTFAAKSQHLIETIRSMAEIKVVRRRFHIQKTIPQAFPPVLLPTKGDFEIIAIGVSVGGPQALKLILSKLPANFPIPIVIVQHMTPGFISGFAKWLNDHSALTIKIAADHEFLTKGTVYFPPDNHHLEIKRVQGKLTAHMAIGTAVSGFCPSATVLLNSVAKVSGKNAIGILLTGMGNDGAQGLLALKQAHGHTLIQDSKSSVVFGMAGIAQSMGAVDKIVELSQLADYLIKITIPM